MAISEMGAGRPGAAQQTVDRGIRALVPSAVIMAGIAFGVDETKQSIGDVLVSEHIRLYELQRVGTKRGGPRIILRGDRSPASTWLLNRMKAAAVYWRGATLCFGVVLTGEKLVDNLDFRAQLLNFEPEAIGGEMEGAGLYTACQDRKVDWILVKGICDWADGNKERDREASQRTAALNAARFVLHALTFAPFHPPEPLLLSKRRRDPKPSASVRSGLPPQPHFFGREAELETILDAIAPESRTWGALIDGPGGIGKTALAIRAGYLAPATDFDRKIFLSAKARLLTPAGEQGLEDFMLPNYLALLTELARELHELDLTRLDPAERAKAVRRALSDKRVLILIDNVETFAEVERNRLYQFLSYLPPSCKAIVTSRRRADIDARPLHLDRLRLEDAQKLLDELARSNRLLTAATPAERQGLYEQTGGNPLLMTWVVKQLGRAGSHCRTLTEASTFLREAPVGNDPLEYVFGDLLDTFTDSETKVLAALAHFTQPSTSPWIAELAGIDERPAQTALEDLHDRVLLVSDPKTQEFLMPPLFALFFRRKRSETLAQTGERLADRAYALVNDNGYESYERFPQIESGWPLVDAALPLIIQGDNGRLQPWCQALKHFLDFSGRWDELLLLSQKAEQQALAVGDLLNAGWRTHDQGWGYYLRGQAAEVLTCATRAADQWQMSNAGASEKGTAIRLRGLGHRLQKEYTAAIAAHSQALALWRTVSQESVNIVKGMNSLAEVERLRGDYPSAERDYREALRIAIKIGDREGIAYITGNLADVAAARNKWADAERLAREALTYSDKLGRQEVIAEDCRRIALALARQGRKAEGLRYARRAVEIYTGLLSPDLTEAQTVLKECEI